MKTNILTLCRKHFNNPLASPALNRRNRREYVRALRVVGDKWLLVKKNAVSKTAGSH